MPSFELHWNRGLLRAPLEVMEALARRIKRQRRIYRDSLQLAAMSDPELQDIGISRSDVFSVIQGSYRRASRGICSKADVGTEVAVPARRRKLRPMEKISVPNAR
jgi:uncharacterized protein YjiS (DUF1127 family)